MQSAMNGSNFLHDYVFAGVSGKWGKIEAKKGESKTPLPYPLRKAGYSGYLCWCLGETFLGPLKMTHDVAFVKRKGL